MNNEVGDKSPNEAATEWLIVGETLALVPLRFICRGDTIRLKEERKKKKEEWWAGQLRSLTAE